MSEEPNRYEISILVGPCSQNEAENAMQAAADAALKTGVRPGAALAANWTKITRKARVSG